MESPNQQRSRRQRRSNVLSFLVFLLALCPANAFSSWQMAAYKPPVKSSVSKIRSPRWSSTSTEAPQMDHASMMSKELRPPSKQRAFSSSSSAVASNEKTSFQQRMRGLVTEDQQKVKIATQQRQSMPANVCAIETLQEYKQVVGDSNQLVVVRFYAPWCRACKAIQPIFYKLATQFAGVQFVDVACTEKNANLHSGLGVPSLPFVHVYHPTRGLVEEGKLSRKHFPTLARKLQSYVQGRCDLKEVGDASCPYLPVNDDDEEVTP